MYTGSTVEPFFMLTYYANIIRSWFKMPAEDERFTKFTFQGGPGGQMTDGNTYMSWSTPNAEGAVIGMLVWSAVCLTIAYLVFRRRQNK